MGLRTVDIVIVTFVKFWAIDTKTDHFDEICGLHLVHVGSLYVTHRFRRIFVITV